MKKFVLPPCVMLLIFIHIGCAPTSLLDASRKGDIDTVKTLLIKNEDVNLTANDGGTPLMLAARYGHEKIVQLLIDKGADVNASDKSNSTPLTEATFSKNINIAKLLIENGAKVNHCGGYPAYTPLIAAAKHNYTPELVQLFIDKGAEVNAICDKQIALSKVRSSKVAETLIKNGAYVNFPPDPEFKNIMPPLQAALCNADIDVAKVLLAHGAKKPENEAWLIVPHNVNVTIPNIPRRGSGRFFKLPAGRYTLSAVYHYEDKFNKMMNRKPDPTIYGKKIFLNLYSENGQIYVLGCRTYTKRKYWKAWIEELN